MPEVTQVGPRIWLRSFFGFSPERDGYIGWSREAGRDHMLEKLTPDDVILIYGAGSGNTANDQKLRVLGFLQADPVRIRDIDKASPEGLQRKAAKGWDAKWTYALPVRRAWRVQSEERLERIAFETYRPERGRAIAAWSPALTPEEASLALDLLVTEVSVFGEPPLSDGLVNRPLREAFGKVWTPGAAIPDFGATYERFNELLQIKSGYPFHGFDEGLAAVWESYKPRLREHALSLLQSSQWTEAEIGSGAIVSRTIDAIEIQDISLNLTNNLVFWQNRFGHANRDHRALLEAISNSALRYDIENALFDLFRRDADLGATFDRLGDLTDAKYPLVAYLFFLRDMDRFMPIQPTGFDRAFKALGTDLITLRKCSWDNYTTYNATLDALRPLIAGAAGLKHVRLLDAHSFCWILSTLLKQEAEGALGRKTGEADPGRVAGRREVSIANMRLSIENTVKNSNGQTVERTVRNKELALRGIELEKYLASLMDLQGDRCALTGIPFHYAGPDADKQLLPSADRKDSSGHYVPGNIQVVCRFINFWKNAQDNDEFTRLLRLVRNISD